MAEELEAQREARKSRLAQIDDDIRVLERMVALIRQRRNQSRPLTPQERQALQTSAVLSVRVLANGWL